MRNALTGLEELPVANCGLVKEFVVVLYAASKVFQDLFPQKVLEIKDGKAATIKELLTKILECCTQEIWRLGPSDPKTSSTLAKDVSNLID